MKLYDENLSKYEDANIFCYDRFVSAIETISLTPWLKQLKHQQILCSVFLPKIVTIRCLIKCHSRGKNTHLKRCVCFSFGKQSSHSIEILFAMQFKPTNILNGYSTKNRKYRQWGTPWTPFSSYSHVSKSQTQKWETFYTLEFALLGKSKSVQIQSKSAMQWRRGSY